MAKSSRSARVYGYALGVLFLLLASWCATDWYSAFPPDAPRNYVGRQTCAKCHENQMESWHDSDHDRAMELASDLSVLGDFNDAEFTRLGATTRFFRRDDKFLVNTEGPDGQLHDYEIKYTFGVRPLQQYMVEFPDGRVQVLRESWDTVQGEWFYVSPPDVTDELLQPDDPLHWTGLGQNWNSMCADCHSTNLKKNYDLATDTYHTTFSEIDVSCETCHGPASLHIELAESRSPFWDRRHGYGLAGLKRASSTEQVETCAPCHSRRSQIHADFHASAGNASAGNASGRHAGDKHAGDRFLDHFDPALLREGLYHADGQISDEVYVYGSFLQSKMYHEGVRCTDCHNPHSLQLKFEGNRLCTQCHLPGKYDSPTHHHHTDPAATQCVNCHMPEQLYMVVDGRRDHSLRIPRPDLSEQLQTPNACNNCHTQPEESAAWAAQAVRQWYGDKRPGDPHYGIAIAAGRRGDAAGADLLQQLLRRSKTPDIVRATAIELLAGYQSPATQRLVRKAVDDANPLVRTAGIRALSLEILLRFPQQVAARLEDSVRLVRLAAARRLVGEAARRIDVKYRDAMERALVEYRSAQNVMQERAAAHLNLAAISQAQGNSRATQKSLRTAMQLEPYLSSVRDKLAILLEQSGGDPDEIRKLREEETELLARNGKFFPKNSALRYERGMLLYLLGDYNGARQAIEKACELGPETYANWLALALICEKQQRWQQAGNALKQMNTLRPNDPAVRGIFQRIQQARGEP